jgi:hypothetical protein
MCNLYEEKCCLKRKWDWEVGRGKEKSQEYLTRDKASCSTQSGGSLSEEDDGGSERRGCHTTTLNLHVNQSFRLSSYFELT